MSDPTLNIMLSAAGRRVALLRILEQSLAAAGLNGAVLATDITAASPACHAAGEFELVPPYRQPGCLEHLLELCQRRKIGLIVPTIDPDLPFYAKHRAAFEAVGARIGVSAAAVVEIGRDKQRTHDWLVGAGLPTVEQCAAAEVLGGRCDWPRPLIAKPRFGSASKGVARIDSADELAMLVGDDDYIVQRPATGDEYTVDVFVDEAGRCRCAVPRKRLEVRAGEVSKGLTVRNEAVMAVARRVAEALPGALGVLNVQMFHDAATDRIVVIEINARFGGGYPLTDRAGATMARWLIETVAGLECSARDDGWRDGLVMLRYDEAVFVDAADAGLSR